MNLGTLSKAERKQLKDNIDFILSYLGIPIPIQKKVAPDPDDLETRLARIERKINAALQAAWKAQTKKAYQAAVKLLKKYGQKITQLQAEALANGLGQIMGTQMVQLVEEQGLVQHIQYTYDMVGNQTAKTLMLPYQFTIVDEKVKDMLSKDIVYWIGNYYNQSIKDAVTGTVIQYAIEEGQDHWVTGQRIADVLAGTYDIPPKYLPTSYVRAEAYWQGLATNAVTRATVLARIEPMIQADVEEYEIISAGDKRVCPLCRFMNGKVFRVERAVELRDKYLAAQSPQDIKTIHPWRKLSDIQGWDDERLSRSGMQLPPYHYFCRCDHVAHSFKEYDRPVSVDPEPVRPRSEVPRHLGELKHLGSGAHLGGAGKKDIYEDDTGQQYIFKPAQSKGGQPEPFRAYIQQAVSDLATKLYDPGQFIEVRAVKDASGQLGTLQKLQPDVTGNLKQIDWKTLPQSDWKRIQEEHVLDWIVGNFDSHAGNFIKLQDGRLLAVDKEQAFRYINDPVSWKISLDYHPNKAYGEWEPLYNTIYRDFAQNKVDLDLQSVLPVLKRLEQISDDEYRAIIRPYAEALYGKGIQASELVEKALKRKHRAREDFRTFFTQLLQQRYPDFKGTFKFLDELTPSQLQQQPLSAAILSVDDLNKLTVKTLKNMAKNQGIKYFQHMTKAELTQALANPGEAGKISLAVKARVQAAKLARKPPPAPAKTTPQGIADVFENLDNIGDSPIGAVAKKDSRLVEGQQITVRRIQFDGNYGYQIYFKVPEFYHRDVGEAMKRLGSTSGEVEFYAGIHDKNSYVVSRQDVRQKKPAWVLKDGNVEVYFCSSQRLRAYLGYFEMCILEPDGKKAAKAAREMLQRLNLGNLIDDPTEEDDKLRRLNTLAWQLFPRDEYDLPRSGRTVAQMEKFLQDRGIAPGIAYNLKEEEVYPGYKALINPDAVKEYKQAGAVNLFAGVGNDPKMVTKILGPDSPGLVSTIQRYHNGIFGSGASEGSDEGTGGADSVFLRLVTKSAKGKHSYGSHYKGGGYKLVYDVQALERCDWYAYNADQFGTTEEHTFRYRKSPVNHIRSVDKNYSKGNEIMFRRGLSNKYITEIHCDNDWDRQSLINELKRAGIDKFNGKKMEDLVKVRTKI